MQQCRKPCPLVPPGCLVHPLEVRRQGAPALCPDLGLPLQAPSGPTPSLGTPRYLRRRHRYYGPVRRPTSARWDALVCPRVSPPSVTPPTVPIGPPGSRRWPFVREAALDPGGASPSRIATAHMLPSATGTASASTTFTLSGLPARTPHDPCLRFGPRVATRPARLGSGLPATALAGRDFHPQVISSLPSALPIGVEKRNGAFFRWRRLITTNRPPGWAASGGTRHGQG